MASAPPPPPSGIDRRDSLVAILIALGLVLFLLPAVRQDVDQHHDGIMLKPALDVLSGQVLFRDTFMQYGALTAYLQAAALWFQPTLASIRYLTLAAYVVTILFLYRAWRQILPRSLAILSCGLFLLFIPTYESNWLGGPWTFLPWSSVLALMFQAIALHALFKVIRDVRPGPWGLVVGATCAAVFWCRQPVGVIMTGSIGVIWLALHLAGWMPKGDSKRAIFGQMVAGYVLIHALLLGSLVMTGAIPEWWYQNFVWPRKMVGALEHGLNFTFFLRPWPAVGLLLLLAALTAPAWFSRIKIQVSRRGWGVYYALLAAAAVWQHTWVFEVVALRRGGWSLLFPVVVLVQAAICLGPVIRRPATPLATEYYLVASLAALAAGSLLQYYPLPDPWHVIWALGPAFGLILHGCWRGSRWPSWILTLALVATLLPAAWGKVQSIRESLARPLVILERPAVLRDMRVPVEFAQRMERIATLVERVEAHRPGIPSVLIGNDALLLCFTRNLTNPSPYFVTWAGLAPETENQRRWSYIREVRPLMFLHRARWGAVGEFYRKERYVPVIYFPEDALEVALPQEIADALGISVYGVRKETTETTPAP